MVPREVRFLRLQPIRCSMKIAILKERRLHETRVAATPETVKKLKALGAEEIVIEAGAGVAAAYTDEAYAEAGAMIVPDAASAAAAADVIFKIQRPMAAADGIDELALLRQGQVLMSPLGALTNAELVSALAAKGVTAFALELIPRITRARLDRDLFRAQRFQLLDGLGGRGHAGLMWPAFFQNGDFHGATVGLRRRKRTSRRTMHSVPALAKAHFRRVVDARLPDMRPAGY